MTELGLTDEELAALQDLLTVPEEQVSLERQRAMIEALRGGGQQYRSPMAAGVGAIGNLIGGGLRAARGQEVDQAERALIDRMRAGRGAFFGAQTRMNAPLDTGPDLEIEEAELIPSDVPARKKRRPQLGVPEGY